MRRAAPLAAAFALLAALSGAASAAQFVYTGEELFASYCTSCHAQGGEGAAFDLTAPSVADRSNEELATIIADGRKERGMPPFRNALDDHEIARLVAHLRRLQGRPVPRMPALPPPPPRDERWERGRALFFGAARCGECHSVDGVGGLQGPDLSDVSERMTPAQVREAVRRPSAAMTPGYETVVLILWDGRTIRGRSRNATDATIQMLDESGELWTTYFKEEVQSVRRGRRSLMPDGLLEPLTRDQVKDLFYFLLQE